VAKNRFLYVCEDCGWEGFFSTQEMMRSNRPHCSSCGSTYLNQKTKYASEKILNNRTVSFINAEEIKKKMFEQGG